MRIRIALALGLVVLPFAASAQPLSQATAAPTAFVGDWTGSLNAGGQNLPIVFHIAAADGGLSATWDSPSQGAKGMETKSVTLAGTTLEIDVPMVRGGYAGTLSADGKEIMGQWKQGGVSFALDLRRGAAVAEPRRPQTPVPPFPYQSLEVSLPGGATGVSLAGTLTVPAGKGPFPAIVLVTGSGPQDRDETLLGHKPFLVVADYLARRGIAVLRYDDRGFGASSGDFGRATSLDFAADAQAAVDWLAARPEVDPSRVGLAGHSEGGLIAPIVASRDPRLRFIILLAGPGLSGEEILYLQGAAISKAGGASNKEVAEAKKVNRRLYAAAMAPGSAEEAAARVKAIYDDYLKNKAPLGDAERKAALETSAEMATQLTSPWMRTFMALDPRPYLAKVTVPTLALNGGLDLQVPPKENIAAITKAFAGSGHAALLTTKVMPGLNHLFQHAKTGHPGEYASIEETFSPEALAAMGDWILER